MKTKNLLLLLVALLIMSPLYAQDTIRLGLSSFVPPSNVQTARRGGMENSLGETTGGRYNVLVQFNEIPDSAVMVQLQQSGVQLGSYLGGKAYWATINATRSGKALNRTLNDSDVRSLVATKGEWKVTRAIAKGEVPRHARVGEKYGRYTIRYAKNASKSTIQQDLKRAGATEVTVYETIYEAECIGATSEIMRIAALPYVLSIAYRAPALEAFNEESAIQARARLVAAPSTQLGGRMLRGEKIRVGIWDQNVTHHPDFGKRLHTEEYELPGDHGTHVAGTLAGGGFIDPMAQGIAPKAEVWAYNFGMQSNGKQSCEEMREAYAAHRLHLTSNSYGASLREKCGDYLDFAYGPREEQIDQLSIDIPDLVHIYAAGNDQTYCKDESVARYGAAGYNTGTNRAKNIIQVGSVSRDGNISAFSSFGPQDDGRWMPIVCAAGNSVYSTLPGNGYGTMGGTSMACPVVSGVVAQLHERYTQLHPNERLRNDAVKAIIANTATDAGRAHPDFQYGFGIVNAERAVKAIEEERISLGRVKNGETITSRIALPKGCIGVRVLVTWNDPVAVKAHAYGDTALVNDLDLRVMLGGKEYLPWVCSAKKDEVEQVAKRGKDKINNIEQVTLSSVELTGASEIEVSVEGYRVVSGEQEFALTWEYVIDTPRIVIPYDGQIVEPGAMVQLQVDNPPEEYTLELSYNGGKSYTPIGQATGEMLEFPIPANAPVTSEATLRLVGRGQDVVMMDGYFIIAPRTENVKVNLTRCTEDAWSIEWDKLDAAVNGYEVYLGSPNGGFRPVGHTEHADENRLEVDYSTIKGLKAPYFSVGVRLDNTGQKAGRQSVAAAANTSMPLTLKSENFPYKETFMGYPSPHFTIESQGKNIQEAMVYRSAEGVAAGSNSLTFFAINRASTFNEHNYFDLPRNADNYVALSLCSLNLTALPSTETIYMHIRGVLLSRLDERPNTAEMRVRVDGEVAKDVAGREVHIASQHDREWVYAIPCGAVHSVSIEFVGSGTSKTITDEGRDMLALSAITFTRGEPNPSVALTMLRVPYDGPNLHDGTFTLELKNKSAIELSGLTVKAYRDGKWVGGSQIDRLFPYESKEVDISLDVSTDNELGSLLKFSFACEIDTLQREVNGYAEYTINSMGNVVPMPTSYSFERPGGYDPFHYDPRQTVEVTDKIVFTDNGGANQNYTVGQLASVRFKPSDTTQRLLATFRKVDLAAEKAYLLVFTGTPNERMELERMRPRAMLTGQHDGPIRFISEARDGSICFQFGSPVESLGEGWIAEIEAVPARNPISLISAYAQHVGDTPRGEIPVKLTIQNGWNEAQNDCRAAVCIGHEEIFSETLPPLQPGINEVTLKQPFILDWAQPMPIVVTVAGNDSEEKDNVQSTLAIYDCYCIPNNPIEGSKLSLATVFFRETEYKLAAPAQHIRYTLDPPLTLYTEEESATVTIKLSQESQSGGILAAWVDWNDDWVFDDSELIAQKFNARTKEVSLRLQPKGHTSGSKRMRIVLAHEGTSLAPCAVGVADAVFDLQDIQLTLVQGDFPSKDDLQLVSVDAGRSGEGLSSEQPVQITVANQSNEPFKGSFSVVLKAGGQERHETIDCASTPLRPYGGAGVFTLQNSIDLSEVGLHEIEVIITEQPAPVNESNNRVRVQIVCLKPEPNGFYALQMQSTREEWIEPGTRGITTIDTDGSERIASDVTLEFCFKQNHSAFQNILTSHGLNVYTTLNMQGGIPDNALAILIGQRKLVWTAENTLSPGRWHHVSIVLEGCESSVWQFRGRSSVRVYIDGEEQTLHVEGEDGPLYGNLKLFSQFNGYVKLYRAWAKAITSSEAKESSFRYVQKPDGTLPEKCIVEYTFNEGVGNYMSVSGSDYATIHAEKSRVSSSDGIWVKPSSLLAGFSFDGQVGAKKISDSAYEVLFKKGTSKSSVGGKLFAAWPKSIVSTTPNTLTPGVYDFTNALQVRVEASPFGRTMREELTLTFKEDASSACELLSLRIPQNGNNGLKSDLIVNAPIGQTVEIPIGTNEGRVEAPQAVSFEYEVSVGATLIYREKEVQSDTKLDMEHGATLIVRAANGAERVYYVKLCYAQTIAFAAPSSFTYGDSPTTLNGTSSSGLPVEYVVDAPDVVTVADGKLYIIAPGKASITCLQKGNYLYGAAKPVRIVVEVKRAEIRAINVTKSVPFGSPIHLDFEYIGLKNGDRGSELASPTEWEAYEIVDSEGGKHELNSVLPIGEYTINPRRSYMTACYEVMPEVGRFSVVQGDLWPITVEVKDGDSQEPLAGVAMVCDGKTYETDAQGRAVAILRGGRLYPMRLQKTRYSGVVDTVDLTQGGAIVKTVSLSQDVVTLAYTAGIGGKVIGKKKQTIGIGGKGESMLAVAQSPYYFVGWSDGVKENPRCDFNVKESKHVEAQFSIPSYAVTYSATGGGYIDGNIAQRVKHGESGAAVTAVPLGKGVYFAGWSDGLEAAERVERSVERALSVEAEFEEIRELPDCYTFDSLTQRSAYRTLRGDVKEPLWNVYEKIVFDGVEYSMTGRFVALAKEGTSCVYSPVYRLTGIDGDLTLKMRAMMVGSMAQLQLQYEVDGRGWKDLPFTPIAMPKDYTMHVKKDEISDGKTIRFRWVASVGTKGFAALDNVCVLADLSKMVTVSYTSNPKGGATFWDENRVVESQSVSLGTVTKPIEARPAAGFQFLQWGDGNFSAVLPSSLPIQNTYAEAQCVRLSDGIVRYVADPQEGGYFTIGGTPARYQIVEEGDEAKDVVAHENEGYWFAFWAEDGGRDRKKIKEESQSGVRIRRACFIKARYKLILRVQGESGPLRNATLSVDGRIFTTNEAGEFIVSVPEGTFSVIASADGYMEMRRSVTVVTNMEVNIQLQRTVLPTPPPINSAESTVLQSLKLWPNPAKSMLEISTPFQGLVRYEIQTLMGVRVLEGVVAEGGEIALAIECLPMGMYIVLVENRRGKVASGKFIAE